MATLIVSESFTGTPGDNATSPATIFTSSGFGGSYTFATGPTGTGGKADQRQLIYEFAPLDLISVEVSMYLPTLPTTNFNPKKLLLLSDTSFNNLTVRMLTSGILRLEDRLGDTWSGTVPVPAATNFRVVMDVDTLVDTVEVSLYIGANINGGTPDDVISATVASEEAIETVILNAFASDSGLAVTYDDFYLYDATATPPVPAPDESLSGRGWPPLIFTDIRREYWTGNYGAYRELGEPGAATTYINSVEAVDIYPPNDFYTHHVCRLPNGFQDKEYRNGLAFGLTHQYQYSATELQDVSYAYIHRKEEDPSGYERNWVRLDETAVGGPYGPLAYAGGWSQVILAPQRMGPYVYGIGLYMDSFTDDEIFSLWRFKDASTVETLEYIYTDGGASTVERSAFLKVFEGVSNYPAMELYGNCEMFVSDERPARIFFLGGRKATWWDDDSKHGLYVTSYGNDPTASGPAWLNRQTFAAQAADELPNPSLVFPWASGDYGAPQVWFYKKVKKAGKNTGQIAIYRSKFDGSEWDEDWDSSANKVGVFGPLDGLQLEGNGDQQHDPLVIKVARDPRSKNHLRMVVAAGNEFDDSPAYENYATRSNPPMMWTLDSYDDGLTWLRSRKFPVAKRGVYGGPIGNYDGSLSSLNGKRTCNLGFAVSGKGEVICGVTGGTPTGKTDPDSEYPWNSIWKYRATLVYPDYTGKGKGDQTSAKTDHRRSHHRESWVQ